MKKELIDSSKEFQLHWVHGQFLELSQKSVRVQVKAISNFPWSHPESFISICDKEGEELVHIQELNELGASSKKALKCALGEARFLLEVKAIHSVTEEADLRVWKASTQVGERQFVTKLDAWPQALDNNRLLITDVSGDLYEIKDIELMDKKRQKLLWALVDWE